MKSNRKETENKGCLACDSSCECSLQEELRNVINLMGPSTPHVKSCSESDQRTKKVVLEDANTPSTPKDISEYSSIPMDSVEVYLEPPRCFNCISQEEVGKHVSRKDIISRKLSSMLSFKSKEDKDTLDLYKINIIQTKDDSSPPRRVIFDLVDELPKASKTNAATNTTHHHLSSSQLSTVPKCMCGTTPPPPHSYWNMTNMMVKHDICTRTGKGQKNTMYERRVNAGRNASSSNMAGNYNINDLSRVDVYYFDHGNSAYYHTTDSPPVIMMEILAEKTENYTMKFWAEVFGTIHVGFSFFTSFILQLFRFIFYSLIRPLTIGLLQLFSDYFIKPLLATIFNAVIQPPLIFIYNICTTLRDICDPLAEGMGYFVRECSVFCKSIRLIKINSACKRKPAIKSIECNCEEGNE